MKKDEKGVQFVELFVVSLQLPVMSRIFTSATNQDPSDDRKILRNGWNNTEGA